MTYSIERKTKLNDQIFVEMIFFFERKQQRQFQEVTELRSTGTKNIIVILLFN